jgi:hypothetical protein
MNVLSIVFLDSHADAPATPVPETQAKTRKSLRALRVPQQHEEIEHEAQVPAVNPKAASPAKKQEASVQSKSGFREARVLSKPTKTQSGKHACSCTGFSLYSVVVCDSV